MANINENYLKLPGDYLFPRLREKVHLFRTQHSEADIISLGLGDVTQPLPPAIVMAMQTAIEEMGALETFRGYGPARGYDFLIDAIIENSYSSRGINFERNEIFISDGSKCDLGNIAGIFGTDNLVAVPDPVFPLYVDTNVMAGRTGSMMPDGRYDGVVYLPCTAESNFVPVPPVLKIDLIYLCFPNNPTGAVATRDDLSKWIDYAHENSSIILYDAAYEAYIVDGHIPHSIFEIEGARDVAIEFRSFSKSAGFTGIRCGYIVIPNQLNACTKSGEMVKVNPFWERRQNTKFNGASYITQVGAASVFSPAGFEQTDEIIHIYLNNAARLLEALTKLGYTAYGGRNAPYIWMKTPDGMHSWDFFEYLLDKAHIVVTPGVGFGPSGEGYIRISAFALPENIERAVERLKAVT